MEDQIQEESLKSVESEELIHVCRNITDLLLLMGKNDLVVNNENRRDVIVEFLEKLSQNNQIGSFKIIDEQRLIKVQKLIQKLKLRDQESMDEEDIELCNRKLFERYIRRSVRPQVFKALS